MRAVLQSTSLILALAVLAGGASAQDQMPWQPNLETAQRVAAQTNRLVLIHFWAPWCRPCLRLDQEVFCKPETAKGLETNFVLVKLNADEAPGTTRLYGVSSLPTDVITTPEGRLVSQIHSPPTASQYVQQMNQAAAGHRALARRNDRPPEQPSPAQATPPASTPPVDSGAAYDSSVAPFAHPAAAGVAAHQGAAAPQAAPPVDRYAEYFPSDQPATSPYDAHGSQVMPAQAYGGDASTPPANPYADPYALPSGTAPPADRYAAPPASRTTMHPYDAPPAAAQSPVAVAPYAPPTEPNAQTSFQPPASMPQLPPGCPPAGLDGHCPVTLVERKHWAPGHTAFGAVHRGRTYLFLGPQEKEKFLADPDRYSPVLSGLDPVYALDNQTAVPGKREFGVFGADGQIYLFADEASRARFEQQEQQYASRVQQIIRPPAYQAMRP